jgi:hypothetical protein
MILLNNPSQPPKCANLGAFPKQVLWERLEPLGVAVVFSKPSLAYNGPGFLNARGWGSASSQRATLVGP